MCGRTSLFAPPDVVRERFDADLLDPSPADELRAYSNAVAVDGPANDSPAVVEEVPAEEEIQTGLDEF